MTYHAVPPNHFDRLYAHDPDPWRFQTSAYEREKYAETLAALGDAPIASALEIGCSIGVLTRALGLRCGRVLGVDLAEAALDAARARCADLPHVRFERMDVPIEFPDERFDLIVLSEVLYFFTADGIDALARRIAGALEPGARIVIVNWLGSTDTELPGDASAERFISSILLTPTFQRRTDRWRLDLLAAA